MNIKQKNKIKKKQWEKQWVKKLRKTKTIHSNKVSEFRELNQYYIDPLCQSKIYYCLRTFFLYKSFNKEKIDTIAGYCYDDYISYKKELKQKWSKK